MNVDVFGSTELVAAFGDDVQAICSETSAKLPFSRVMLVRDTAGITEDQDAATLRVVIYGSSKYSTPCVPWQGQFRYQNDWNVAVPIFDDNAQPIAELVGDRLLFILIPLPEDDLGQKLLTIIFTNAFEILITEEGRLKKSEDLLIGKVSEDVRTVLTLFGAVWSADPGIDDAVGEFGQIFAQTSAAYDQIIDRSQTMLRSFQEENIAVSLQKFKACALITRAFVDRGTLFVEYASEEKVLRFYWNARRGLAEYEVSGVTSRCSSKVVGLLSKGLIFEGFSVLAREKLNEEFGAGAEQSPSLKLELIGQDSGVKSLVSTFRDKAAALYEIAHKGHDSESVTRFIRRWYLISQALALRTMKQFIRVEYECDKIFLTAENVINVRDGDRPLGTVRFSMLPTTFSLCIDDDRRPHQCRGDASDNYSEAIKRGHLVAAAEILWRHVTVG